MDYIILYWKDFIMYGLINLLINLVLLVVKTNLYNILVLVFLDILTLLFKLTREAGWL